MGLRKPLLAVLLAFALVVPGIRPEAQAGPAYEKSGKYEAYPTFEGNIVTIDADAGRLSLRGDGGFRTFNAAPGALTSLEKDTPVRVTYERDGSGYRAIRIVSLVVPDGATRPEDIAEDKEKLIEKVILEEIAEARER